MSIFRQSSALMASLEVPTIQAKEILRIRDNIYHILVKHTRQAKSRVQADIERDFIMTPAMSRDYGLIDQILTTRPAPKK